MRTLEQYLRDELGQGGAEGEAGHFMVRARHAHGKTSFYIFPSYRSGDVVDFVVDGNSLVTTAEQIEGHKGMYSPTNR
jgi:hypothetical protein